jgi:competence protein ComEA
MRMKYLSSHQQIVIFFIIISLFGLFLWQEMSEKAPRAERARLLPEGQIYVEVLGDIQKEGIYCFAKEVTVREAVAEAGGTTGRMALAEDISSQRISNGSKLIVSGEKGDSAIIKIRRMEPEKLMIYSIPLELNQATKEELVALPGIGEKLAVRIIEYRKAKRGFSCLEELMEVKGIGRGKYEKLERLICLH